MKKTYRLFISLVLAVALLSIPTLLAAAKQLASLVISGPGIKGEQKIDDPQDLMKLQDSGFLFGDFRIAVPPKDPPEGYSIMVYFELEGNVVPFVQMMYYPAEEGQSGYIHYTGHLDGDSMKLVAEDNWRVVPWSAASAFHEIAATHGITLQTAISSEPAGQTSDSAARSPTTPVANESASRMLALVAAVLIPIAILGLVLRRRIAHRTTAGD